MIATQRKPFIAFFITLGACLVGIAITLNVGWIVLNWRTGTMLVLGILFFPLIISGLVLNTIFLVREIRRNDQHDSFINSVSHELKTPITSIRLYLQTLQTRPLDEARRQEFYNVMMADSERLLATVEQVLRTGRAGRLRRSIDRARIHVPELVRESVELVRTRNRLPEDFIRLRALAPDNALEVIGDVEELRVAVLNLLDNAVKYSANNVDIDVEIDSLSGQQVVVRVRDHGVGLAAPELKHIFKRFYRVPGTMRIGGTGLGLFIVRSVAKRHGGRAFADSEGPGRGSTFTLQLPAAPAL